MPLFIISSSCKAKLELMRLVRRGEIRSRLNRNDQAPLFWKAVFKNFKLSILTNNHLVRALCILNVIMYLTFIYCMGASETVCFVILKQAMSHIVLQSKDIHIICKDICFVLHVYLFICRGMYYAEN